MSVKDNFSVAATLSQLRYLVFQGMKGDTGDSAYEEAVALGFVGTEAEWLASLKGEKGDPGADAEGAVRYDETQTLTDAQKNTACGNIGAIGQLEYDAIQQSLSALDADISLKADEADLPTKVSDLENDTGYITASQVPAAPVQSVNGRTGAVSLGAADVHALPDSTVIPPTVTEQTVSGWGFTKNAVRYDEQMALSDTQKATARANIGAVGKLEYDAIQQSLSALDADISLKADEADLPTKVSDLENDTGYITASQVPAAPVQSVNGRTGSVTVNEVPAVGGTDNKKVLTADNGTYSWEAVQSGETTKRISLYKNSQTGVYTCSMSATQLHEALPNVVLATEDYRVPVSAYSIDKDDSYVKAVFIDDRPENNAAIVWTLSAASASDLVAVTREECSIEGLPDYTLAVNNYVLAKTTNGPRWVENIPRRAASLRLLYDGAFAPSDPDLYLMSNLGIETAEGIWNALYYGTIGSAEFVDVSTSTDHVVYDLYRSSAENGVASVVFTHDEADCIRTVTMIGNTKSVPTFGTIPLGGLPAVTASDNGKFLRVVSGAWAAQAVQTWQGGSY